MRLEWGVKQSFRSYVQAVGGTTEVGGGTTRTPDGGFTFAPAADSDLRVGADGRPQGAGAFLGEVKFAAHGGMLAVFLADPRVELREDGAVLTVADTAARDYRLAVAKLDLAGASIGGDGAVEIPAAVSIDGSQLLGDHYPYMTPLDPVRLVLGA